MNARRQIVRTRRRRTGSILPALAVALLTALACLALVLDRLWIEAASLELTVAAESAALAAAGELANDDLLGPETDGEKRLDRARRAGLDIAARNRVAGRPVELDGRDIRFGRLVTERETGFVRFLESGYAPTTVVVTAIRNRPRGNPLALLIARADGPQAADVSQRAAATLDNRVAGFRPFAGTNVPLLPLAILADDPTGNRNDTWSAQIEQRLGQDRYGYDRESGRVSQSPDGLPEIVLRSMAPGNPPERVNCCLVDLGSNFRAGALARQIETGCGVDDFAFCGGELRFDGPAPQLRSLAIVPASLARALQARTGCCLVCLLYAGSVTPSADGTCELPCPRPVAGRVMAVRVLNDGVCEIVFQPGVTTTRTAIVADSSHSDAADANPYIYNLQLTY